MISNAAGSYGVEQLMNQANVPGAEDLDIPPVYGPAHVVRFEIPQPAESHATFKTVIRPTIIL
jgi:hypothetical protein